MIGVAGWLAALPDLVGIGVTAVALVGGAAVLALVRGKRDAELLSVERVITPAALHAGDTAELHSSVQAVSQGGQRPGRNLNTLTPQDTIPSELLRPPSTKPAESSTPLGGDPHLAEGTTPESLSLETGAPETIALEPTSLETIALADRVDTFATLHPPHRGRWSIGPVRTTRLDAFGLYSRRANVGPLTPLTAWPAVTAVPVESAMGTTLRRGARWGASQQSPDDAVLREYVPGDDPRRIHWRAAARQGSLMVRAEDSGTVTGVTVLLDSALLTAPSASRSVSGLFHQESEWVVEHVASLACSLLDAGYHVRFVATGEPQAVTATQADHGRIAVLDACVDLHGFPSVKAALSARVATTATLAGQRTDNLVAVIPAFSTADCAALAHTVNQGGGIALVIGAHPEATLNALTSLGWNARAVQPTGDHRTAWLSR
ncbi:MAG: DUF58 domain-containing protein [Cellulomonadaceae bacterium]|nr:DUF58 domain-containing protein [Cellulomonadaceae bacterium]